MDATTNGANEPTIDELLAQAVQNSVPGKIPGAIRLYQRILDREPDNVSALTNLGALYFQLGNVDKTLPLALKCFDLAPNDPESRKTYLSHAPRLPPARH